VVEEIYNLPFLWVKKTINKLEHARNTQTVEDMVRVNNAKIRNE